MTSGYWNDPDETSKFFRYTGDLAQVDHDGFIYLVDRARDFIKSGGQRVSAREIEEAIAGSGEVTEAAVVGTPHEMLGEAIVAFVVVESDEAQSPNVLDHCRRHLPLTKVPEAVVHLTTLPHNDSGKIGKGELRSLAAAVLSSASADVHDERVVRIERKRVV